MFFTVVVLCIWTPVLVSLYLLKSGKGWGLDRPLAQRALGGCGGILLGAPTFMFCGVLTEHHPILIVPTCLGSSLFFYSGGLLFEIVVNKMGLSLRKSNRKLP